MRVLSFAAVLLCSAQLSAQTSEQQSSRHSGTEPDYVESTFDDPTSHWQSFSSEAVATDHALASEAGERILREGGTAADAAAAALLALGVVSPASSGLGGGGFLLYYRASDRSVTFVDFRERAPTAATETMFENAPAIGTGPLNAASQLGGLASGVPGEAAGIAYMVRTFGRLPLRRIVRPAAGYAADGIQTSSYTRSEALEYEAQMRQDPTLARYFDEASFADGGRLRQPELARTLLEFGRGGERAFYRGRIAREIVQASQARGGVISLEDLAHYQVTVRRPLEGNHFGYRFVTAPPPSAGGFTLLQSLSFLEGLHESQRSNATSFHHALLESWKGPFFDRERYFGDPDFTSLPLEALRQTTRLHERVALFHPGLAYFAEDYEFALPTAPSAGPVEDHGTTHLCVADSEGNIAAVTSTINLAFGARYTAAGMVMNDEMDDFATTVGSPNAFGLVGGAFNRPQPGKRPVSSMTPTIVFNAQGLPVMCAGAAGGSRIITATEQVILGTLLEPNGHVGEAMAAPRLHHQAHPAHARYEEVRPIPRGERLSLEARGHRFESIHHIAAAQAIHLRYPESGREMTAASDPRKGGRPAGR